SSYMVTDRIRIGMSAGYEVSEYEATDTGGVIDREDTYFFVRPTITYTFNSHLSANLFYQYSTNDSSTGPGSSFDRNQIGLYLSLAF
ncbi:MAG: MtrB/PioB family outer membrane beta-barrel protein, partial [Prosthecobacter sp.]|nr:MtrB/PioB family outer membrane beta-barrel protein [Prosthecobacter sp.]